jgi:hypothetical protein
MRHTNVREWSFRKNWKRKNIIIKIAIIKAKLSNGVKGKFVQVVAVHKGVGMILDV